MGLFDRKYCDICGEKIGLLGNRKLEDGNLCKECARKLSPRFTERKESTVEQIRTQLKYREENREKLNAFRVTDIYGTGWEKLYMDAEKKCFVVSDEAPDKGNPDIVTFDMVSCCEVNVSESRKEIKYKARDGRTCSYEPAQYAREFDFYVTLSVSHPYFDRIKYKLNGTDVTIEPQFTVIADPNRLFNLNQNTKEPPKLESPRVSAKAGQDPATLPEYIRYIELGNALSAKLLQKAAETVVTENTEDTPASSAAKITCPYCNSETEAGSACKFCGAPLN